MSQRRFSWEGFLLTFLFVSTVLLGAFYVLSWNYGFRIPWLLLLLIALGIALVFTRRPRRQ